MKCPLSCGWVCFKVAILVVVYLITFLRMKPVMCRYLNPIQCLRVSPFCNRSQLPINCSRFRYPHHLIYSLLPVLVSRRYCSLLCFLFKPLNPSFFTYFLRFPQYCSSLANFFPQVYTAYCVKPRQIDVQLRCPLYQCWRRWGVSTLAVEHHLIY